MRKLRRHRWIAILLVLSVSFSLLAGFSSAVQAQSSGTPVRGGTLRLALSEEPDQLDPARTIELTAGQLMAYIYDQLVYFDAHGLPQGWLAQSWTIAPDGKTITFKIRPGIKFTDGTPLDATAIKFNYDRLLDPKMAAPYKKFLGTLTSVDAPDASTDVFHFSAPYAPFFINGATIGIVSPTAVQKEGNNFGHQPVGSGPFMFKEWDPGSKLVFVRNPNYVNYRKDDTNKGPAYVDQLVFNVISEAATQTAAFENKELDILSVPREDVARLSKEPDVVIKSLEKSQNINFIEFANKPPFNNIYFRKAVAYAIDPSAVAKIAYLGNATPNQCPVPIGDAAYDAQLCAQHGYSYNPDMAKQMLAKAGWDPNTTVTLWSYAPFPVQSKSIEVIQSDLNKVGIKTKIQTIEFGAMQPKLQSGEIGFDYMRWTFTDQSILSQLFKSPGWTGQSHDPALDKLLDVADTTVDPEARIAATHTAMAYILDHAIIVPVNSDWIQVATHGNVKNYHWDALNNDRLNDVWLSK